MTTMAGRSERRVATGPPRPLRVLAERWPAVMPVCEGTYSERGLPSSQWLKALSAFDELRRYQDRDTLLRRSVELLRDSIGLERCAIFLLGPPGQRLYGTWGTGARGETTDERGIAFDAGTSHREAFAHAFNGTAQWSRFVDVPLFAQTPNGTVVLKRGENVIIPIPGPQQSLGLIACDWALTERTADIESVLRAAVMTRVLSPLLQLLRAEDDAESKQPTMAPRALRDADLAARAASILSTDPNIDRRRLARQLGTTADKLGRAFKATLGETLRGYRNRIRLSNFFAMVDPAGGNLLSAALEAGFGSYAQFHRVFRQHLGCSPIDYLRGGNR